MFNEEEWKEIKVWRMKKDERECKVKWFSKDERGCKMNEKIELK